MRDYSVGHSLYVIAKRANGDVISNSTIEVEDSVGVNYSVQTDNDGLVRLELLEYTYAAAPGQPNAVKTIRQNHTLLIDGFEPYSIDAELFAVGNNAGAPIHLTLTSLSNSAPVLAPIGPKTTHEQEALSFTVTATDADPADTLILSASNLPNGATFINNGDRTGTFNWTPTTSQADTYPDVHFEVTDGAETDFEDITITVLDGAPNCTPDWQCTDWSTCTDSLQTRTCTDTNECGTDAGKPSETQACDSTPPSAVADLAVE